METDFPLHSIFSDKVDSSSNKRKSLQGAVVAEARMEVLTSQNKVTAHKGEGQAALRGCARVVSARRGWRVGSRKTGTIAAKIHVPANLE